MYKVESSLSVSVLRVLETEAGAFCDINNPLYDAALLTRCYARHARHLLSILKQTTGEISLKFLS